jgi:16S rRNA (guanine966-N2)-methyltransferase
VAVLAAVGHDVAGLRGVVVGPGGEQVGPPAAVDARDDGFRGHAGTVWLVRVVAGTARGRILQAPPGRLTRPTSDRVREAMFSMLTSMDAVEGAAVLDLYAGSGALGIEALSRRAASAIFVDDDGAAVAAIRANLEVLGAEGVGRASVVRTDALRYAAGAPQVDLVLIDPPYRFDGWPAMLQALAGRTELLVAETGAAWEPGPGWETVKVKRYGGTVVTVVRPIVRPRSLLRQEGEA